MSLPTITILTPCFNEQGNVGLLHERIVQAMAGVGSGPADAKAMAGSSSHSMTGEEIGGGTVNYVHLFIDNASTDGTQEELRKLAAEDSRVRVILNQRNFGHVRSPFHAMLQATGDAVIVLASDLQDPPELIPEFIKKWREGFPLVLGQKTSSEESALFFAVRRTYYKLVNRFADVELIENATGFGLFDRKVIEALRGLDDPYPYVRGLVCELGFPLARITYQQPLRKRGITKNNFYTLYDLAMLGFTSHSKVPLRLAAMLGFATSALSFLIGLAYLVYKLIYWDRFALGVAPVMIGLFFLGSIQLFFIGIIGEYIGAIHTKVTKRPLVIEKERIGF